MHSACQLISKQSVYALMTGHTAQPIELRAHQGNFEMRFRAFGHIMLMTFVFNVQNVGLKFRRKLLFDSGLYNHVLETWLLGAILPLNTSILGTILYANTGQTRQTSWLRNMTDQSYRVVFEGTIADGFSIGMVKKNLAKLFKADNERIATIFSGQPVVLKKNVDEATARKYQAALLKAGAATIIRQKLPAASPQSSAAQDSPAPPIKPDTDDWSLAPTGSVLLRDNERQHTEEREIDLSHISLASTFLMPEEQASTAPPPPDTGHISIAEPGATLSTAKATEQPSTAIDDLNATLAPVGTELGERSPDTPAPAIDISHLSVVDNEVS